jgi:phosphate transport system substrate-binding protein
MILRCKTGGLFFYVACSIFFLFGCEGASVSSTDTLDSGTIYISVDESFKPVIDSQIQVFESQNPRAKVIPFYKPEAECIKDLAVDSIRMIIITRTFTPQEEDFIVDSFRMAPKSLVIAKDAVALVVNPLAKDSFFTMDEIRQILTGTFRKNLIPIFDGTRATSTVRFAIDSILHGHALSPKTMAAKSSVGVIDYVSKDTNAVGFIGVSWIGNHDDTMQQSFLKKVRMAYVESTDSLGNYILPYQANIYSGRYPMIRDLVYILKEKNIGLGRGFTNFLSGEIGQLIFKRAYLLPTQMNFDVRNAELN